MNFIVNSTNSGTVKYKIVYDEFSSIITEGEFEISAGATYDIPFTLNEPGFVLCIVDQDWNVRKAAAAFSPHDILPHGNEPADFDQFWASQRSLLSSIDIDSELKFLEEDQYTKTYEISLANIDNRRVYGYLSIPKGTGPFPAFISLPSFGASANLVEPDNFTAERAGGISLAISIHNAPADEADPDAYEPDETYDRNKIYYRYAITAAMRAIDYLYTMSEFDKENVCLIGGSQGGGLSLLISGIDDRVNLLHQSNAALSEHSGYKYGKASGFPYYLHIANATSSGDPDFIATTMHATAYYDAIWGAKRFKGKSKNFISYQDLTCPPGTGFSAFNQLPGPKIMVHSPQLDHSNPSSYTNDRYAFFRRHYEASNNPPWPFSDDNQGFFIDAGEPMESVALEATTLSASYELDGFQDPSWAIKWSKQSGPGAVYFNDADALNTNAVFDQPGDYTLRLIVTTPYDEDAEIFFTLVDYVDVSVNESLNFTPSPAQLIHFTVGPSPAENHIRINGNLPNAMAYAIRVRSMDGILVNQTIGQGQHFELDINSSNFPSGIYLIELNTGIGNLSKKIMVK